MIAASVEVEDRGVLSTLPKMGAAGAGAAPFASGGNRSLSWSAFFASSKDLIAIH